MLMLETGVGPRASWGSASDEKTSVFRMSLGRKVDLESPPMYSTLFHCGAESARGCRWILSLKRGCISTKVLILHDSNFLLPWSSLRYLTAVPRLTSLIQR